MELTDRQIAATPCELLWLEGKIVGRASKVNNVWGYECLICYQNDFSSKGELARHSRLCCKEG